MKDRAGRDRGLLRACGAHPHPLAGAPAASAAACRAAEPVRPPQALKVFAAGGVIGEPGLELLVGAGVVDPADGARRRCHARNVLHSSRYAGPGIVRRALAPGGLLVVKDMDTRPRWKARWNAAQEALA